MKHYLQHKTTIWYKREEDTIYILIHELNMKADVRQQKYKSIVISKEHWCFFMFQSPTQAIRLFEYKSGRVDRGYSKEEDE